MCSLSKTPSFQSDPHIKMLYDFTRVTFVLFIDNRFAIINCCDYIFLSACYRQVIGFSQGNAMFACIFF